MKVKDALTKIQNRIKTYRSTPDYVADRWRYGLKRALHPNIKLPIWVTTKNGAKVFLGDDPIDEYILEDVTVGMEERYFPAHLQLKEGDIVLDVGGHHGLYAVELLARYPGIQILSIEPDPIGIASIKRHISKNKADSNIHVVPFAVGRTETTGFLVDNHDGSWGKTLETVQQEDSIRVPVKTLKSMLEDQKIENLRAVKLIKSNCEGGEFDMVPQIVDLGLKPELIVLMIHPPRGDVEGLVTSLQAYGYDSDLVFASETNPCWHFRLKR
ncbi:MAG TPA: FkbM family methyltransferase [Pyrinomonadaceae bacterium]|nr:FkbM family methyltransferase [Pyrinomonadaceae bacterium]